MSKYSISLLLKEMQNSTPVDFFDREILLAHVLKKSREFVLAHPEHPLTEKEKIKAERMIERRKNGEPLAYILGRKEFFGRDFFVTPDTLIPRPETELLVEMAVHALQNQTKETADPAFEHPSPHKKTKDTMLLIDIGTGSGCVVISIAKQMHRIEHEKFNIRYAASDISEKALLIARKNAKQHGVEKEISFFHSDLLEKFSSSSAFPFHSVFVVANLPYVPSPYLRQVKTKDTQGLSFEPRLALDGGEDGFNAYRKLLLQMQVLHKHSPTIPLYGFFEIGYDQSFISQKEIRTLFPRACPRITNDLAGFARIVSFSIPNEAHKKINGSF